MAEVEVYLLTGARLAGVAGTGTVDIGVAHGRVVAVAPRLDPVDMPVGGQVVDLAGRWVLPGLADHHVHFATWARQRGRIDVSGALTAADAVARIRDAVGSGAVPAGDTVVARGFQDALWPQPPTADDLDGVGREETPVVVLSHDLHSVWLNEAAARRYGAPRAGVLREDDAFVMQQVVDAESAPRTTGLISDAVAAAAARGITQIVDLQMEDTLTAWRGRIASGLTALRVRAGLYPEHLPSALARQDRTGDVAPGTRGLLTVGPLKVFGDGSLNTRTAWCAEPYGDAAPGTEGGYGFAAHTAQELAALLTTAAGAGLDVALHAIGDLAVTRALDAFEATGARGSIEHAQLIADSDLERFAALRVAASVQPVHALDDRDVADAVWADRAHRAFPLEALARAGALLRFGSDAPVAPLDPWLAIQAAVARTGDERPAWQPGNALSVGQALAASYGHPRIAVGCAADLVAVDLDPFAVAPTDLGAMPVALTMCAGRVSHRAGL